jgi:hypothetical protein
LTRITFPEDDGPQFELLPEGLYGARIWAVEQKIGLHSGEPYMAFDFKIDDSPRHLFDNFSLQSQSLWRLKRLFQLLGLPSEGTIEVDWNEDVVGKRVQLVVEHKERKGKMRETVTEYRSLKGGGGAPDDDFGEVPF